MVVNPRRTEVKTRATVVIRQCQMLTQQLSRSNLSREWRSDDTWRIGGKVEDV